MSDPYSPDRPPYAAPPAPPAPDASVPPAMPGGPPAPGVPSPPSAAPQRGGLGRLLAAATLGGLLGACAVAAAFAVLAPMLLRGTSAASPAPAPAAVAKAPAPKAADGSVEAAASRVLPSVVNITVRQSDAFGRTGEGNGSGVIVTADGYVLTNNHVIEGADEILVRIGTEDVAARVVGTDPSSDLAVVKVDRTGLPAAELGRSAGLGVGQSVVAVGSPFGLEKTVTLGIVSALNRSNIGSAGSGEAAYTNLIQTDAAINPGNSGGALVDLAGRVVGINTLIQSPSGQVGAPQSAGIGFAIPIDYAKSISDQIIAGKKVQHPFMGISMVTIDETFAAQYGLSVKRGVLVQSVITGSPAQSGGLREGDIIVAIDGREMSSFEDVFSVIRASSIGQTLSVDVVRGEQKVALQVTLGSDTAAR